MALAGARAIWGNDEPVCVGTLRIEKPLPITAGDAWRIQNTLMLDSTGEMQWSVYVCDRNSEETWGRLATGRITQSSKSTAAPRVDTAVQGELLPSATYYSRLREHGLEYGPAFQGIADIETAGSDSIGHVRLQDGVKAEGYCFHPCLLDSCFQVFASLIKPADLQTYLPVGMERVSVRGQCAGAARAIGTLRPAAGNAIVGFARASRAGLTGSTRSAGLNGSFGRQTGIRLKGAGCL